MRIFLVVTRSLSGTKGQFLHVLAAESKEQAREKLESGGFMTKHEVVFHVQELVGLEDGAVHYLGVIIEGMGNYTGE